MTTKTTEPTTPLLTLTEFVALVHRCAIAYDDAQFRSNPDFQDTALPVEEWTECLLGFAEVERVFDALAPGFAAQRHEDAMARLRARVRFEQLDAKEVA
jgi:hypothetical protein